MTRLFYYTNLRCWTSIINSSRKEAMKDDIHNHFLSTFDHDSNGIPKIILSSVNKLNY